MKTQKASFKSKFALGFFAKVALGFFVIISLMVIMTTSTMINYAKTEKDLQKIKEVFLPNALLSGQMARDVVQTQQFFTSVAATKSDAAYIDAERSREDFKNGLEQYRNYVAGDDKKLKAVNMLEISFDLFYNDGKRMAEAYLHEGDEAGSQLLESFDKAATKLSSQMIRLRNSESNGAKESIQNIFDETQQMRNILWIMAIIATTLAIGIAFLLNQYLGKELGVDPHYVKGMAKEISKGDLSRDIYLKPKDNDSVLHSVKEMQQELLERRNAEQKAAAEILRIKNALDNITTGVMIADHERNIIYINKSAIRALAVYEDGIRAQLPTFDSAKLLNSNIDQFHIDAKHQERLLANLKTQLNSELKLGDGTMALNVNPVLNENGEHFGTVVEWRDRTSEVAAEQEVAMIVHAASQGDFSQRFDLNGKEGFLLELAQGLNTLLSTSESSLDDIAHVLSAMSRGDLTQTITNDYSGTFGQLKDDTNLTVEKLKNLVEQIKLATDNIYDGSKEIAAGNNNLSKRTETQAVHLEKTATSMVQFTNVVQSNANNAKRADELALNAVGIATQGGSVVQNVIQTMSNINESAHRIEDIITVIDDIAFQTNILALNAAVEAARAGEQGKGFAVVAVEVRNLAQRSAVAADEIKRLIADSVTQVSDGSQLVAKAGDTMNQIIEAIQGVTKIMTEINGASAQQNEDIGQVSKAINEMESVTQQNAALVEESAAAAESLEEQAENLAAVIGNFRI